MNFEIILLKQPMTHITKEEFDKLANICKIQLSEKEKERVLKNLQNILTHMDKLDELDLSQIPSFEAAQEEFACPLAEDLVSDLLPRELFLKNIPIVNGAFCHTGGVIKVPPVLN